MNTFVNFYKMNGKKGFRHCTFKKKKKDILSFGSFITDSFCPTSAGRNRQELRGQGLPQWTGEWHPVVRVSS